MKWIKDILIIVVLISLIVFAAFLLIEKGKDKVELEKIKADYKESTEELKEYTAKLRLAIAEEQAGRAAEKRKREAADKRIEALQKEKGVLVKERDEAKKAVEAMEDDTLAAAFNYRVGENQLTLTYSGLFSLKRPGTEKAVQLFIDGEACTELRVKDAEEMGELRIQNQSLEDSDASWAIQDKQKEGIINKQKETILDGDEALKRIESWAKKQKWMGRLEGGTAVAVLVILINLFSGG